ncbi:MAG: heavy metal-associated domain-containing protein [Nanoarchaeota archaeon]
MKKATIMISGMHCASCSSNIEKSLKKVGGIKGATVSLLFKKATVEMDDSVSAAQLADAVKRTGYSATDIKIQ